MPLIQAVLDCAVRSNFKFMCVCMDVCTYLIHVAVLQVRLYLFTIFIKQDQQKYLMNHTISEV